jgi:hypothetical protein
MIISVTSVVTTDARDIFYLLKKGAIFISEKS